jgi:hypothetical protein
MEKNLRKKDRARHYPEKRGGVGRLRNDPEWSQERRLAVRRVQRGRHEEVSNLDFLNGGIE